MHNEAKEKVKDEREKNRAPNGASRWQRRLWEVLSPIQGSWEVLWASQLKNLLHLGLRGKTRGILCKRHLALASNRAAKTARARK